MRHTGAFDPRGPGAESVDICILRRLMAVGSSNGLPATAAGLPAARPETDVVAVTQ